MADPRSLGGKASDTMAPDEVYIIAQARPCIKRENNNMSILDAKPAVKENRPKISIPIQRQRFRPYISARRAMTTINADKASRKQFTIHCKLRTSACNDSFIAGIAVLT